jgi:predicted hotdog family 3-hydroxylacyl-ACP dehydratase
MTERSNTPEQSTSESLTEGERAALLAHIEKYGDEATAGSVGVSRLTLARATAGLRVRRGSIELIRRAVEFWGTA